MICQNGYIAYQTEYYRVPDRERFGAEITAAIGRRTGRHSDRSSVAGQAESAAAMSAVSGLPGGRHQADELQSHVLSGLHLEAVRELADELSVQGVLQVRGLSDRELHNGDQQSEPVDQSQVGHYVTRYNL